MNVTVCRSCAAPIIWAITAKTGSRMPVDAEPIVGAEKHAGLFVLASAEDAPMAISAAWFYAGGTPAIQHMPSLYRSHFATCPDAADHRKPPAAVG